MQTQWGCNAQALPTWRATALPHPPWPICCVVRLRRHCLTFGPAIEVCVRGRACVCMCVCVLRPMPAQDVWRQIRARGAPTEDDNSFGAQLLRLADPSLAPGAAGPVGWWEGGCGGLAGAISHGLWRSADNVGAVSLRAGDLDLDAGHSSSVGLSLLVMSYTVATWPGGAGVVGTPSAGC